MQAATIFCVVYARFSDKDREDQCSIADQVRVCREYAARQGWEVIEIFEEPRVSGAAFGNRPAFLRMREAAMSGRFNALLVNDTTRLARSQELAPLVDRFRFQGMRVIGVQDNFDSSSSTADMQAGMSGIMSVEFIKMIRRRTHAALESRAKEGKPTGGKAYDNTEIVQEIFGRFAAGESMKAIASDLNRRKVPSPGANWKPRSSPRGRWLVSALHAILHNERYIGRIVWNRSQWVKNPDTGRRQRRERPQSEWIIQQCEPLIDQGTWGRARARFSTHQKKGGVRSYLLSGLLECGVCGSKLIVVGGSQRRYICGTHHAGGPHACSNAATFPRLVAEAHILKPVIDDLLSPSATEEGIRQMQYERKSAEAPKPRESEEVAALERMVREGILSKEVAAPAIAEAKRKHVLEQQPVVDLPWPSRKAWREAVASMKDILAGDDVVAAREALRGLIGTVKCKPAEDQKHVVAELTARQIMLGTGSGIWVGSGGVLAVHIPIYSRHARASLYKERP